MSGAREKAIERLALLTFSGPPSVLPLVHVDRFVEKYKASAAAGEGNMRESWELALRRARETLDLLGLVAIDPALVARLRETREPDEIKRPRICYGDLTNYGDAVEELADAVVEQFPATGEALVSTGEHDPPLPRPPR